MLLGAVASTTVEVMTEELPSCTTVDIFNDEKTVVDIGKFPIDGHLFIREVLS